MKLRHKIVVAMLCLASLVYGVGGSLLISISCSDSLARAKETAFQTYNLIAHVLLSVGEMSDGLNTAEMTDVLEQLKAQGSYWSALALRTAERTVFADGPILNLERPMTDGGVRVSEQEQLGQRLLCFAGDFSVQGAAVQMDMAIDVTEIYARRTGQQVVYRAIFAVMLALCAAVAWSIVRKITRPLSQLSQATKQLASGNLQYRFHYTADDEVGQLTSDFNAMARRIEKGVDALQESLARQERFIGSFAHELKTPMTSVIGYADLLRSSMLNPDEAREAANTIFHEAQRLERLSIKLLELLVVRKGDFALQKNRNARSDRKCVASAGGAASQHWN